MRTKHEINFKTLPTRNQLTGGKVRYQGRIYHNKAMDLAETRRRFAEYANTKEAQSNLYLDLLGEFIVDHLAQGYRMDFGPFSVGLKLRGGFPSANAPFDEEVNSIGVEMTPDKTVKAATRWLKPLNATELRNSHISGNYQQLPVKAADVIATDGERKMITSGEQVWVHPGAEGEGVWIMNDAGEKLLEGTVIDSDSCRVISTFTGHIDPGRYWFVIASRDYRGGELLSARRRITAE